MIYRVVITLFGLFLTTPAYAADALFTVPDNTFAQFGNLFGTLFTDLFPFIALAIGVSLAFFMIRKMISLLGHLRG